jgi:hypothetical protein
MTGGYPLLAIKYVMGVVLLLAFIFSGEHIEALVFSYTGSGAVGVLNV